MKSILMSIGKYAREIFVKKNANQEWMRNVLKLLGLQWNQQHLRWSSFSHYPLVSRGTFVSGRHCFQPAASFVQVSLSCVSSYIRFCSPQSIVRIFSLSLSHHGGRLFCLRRQLNLYWCHVSCGWQFGNETKR